MTARGAMRPWRLRACIGISSTWCGYSFSHSFIFGRDTWKQSPDTNVPKVSSIPSESIYGSGTAVHFQHLLLSHRLLSFAWLSEMDFDHHLHVAEGRLDRRHLHAHGLGAPGTEICHPRPAAGLADSDWAYGGGRGLHLLDAVGGILAVSETQL